MSPYIAIADDDPDDRMLLADALTSEGFNLDLRFFGSGKELLDQLTSLSTHDLPYLILMDHNMPGEDGSEILRELRKSLIFRSIPVIVLTGMVNRKFSKELYSCGAGCVLQKPGSFRELSAIAAGILLLFQPIVK